MAWLGCTAHTDAGAAPATAAARATKQARVIGVIFKKGNGFCVEPRSAFVKRCLWRANEDEIAWLMRPFEAFWLNRAVAGR